MRDRVSPGRGRTNATKAIYRILSRKPAAGGKIATQALACSSTILRAPRDSTTSCLKGQAGDGGDLLECVRMMALGRDLRCRGEYRPGANENRYAGRGKRTKAAASLPQSRAPAAHVMNAFTRFPLSSPASGNPWT